MRRIELLILQAIIVSKKILYTFLTHPHMFLRSEWAKKKDTIFIYRLLYQNPVDLLQVSYLKLSSVEGHKKKF